MNIQTNKNVERYMIKRATKVRLKFYFLKLPFFLIYMFGSLKRGWQIFTILYFIAIILPTIAGFTYSPTFFIATLFIWLLGILILHLSSPSTKSIVEDGWEEQDEFLQYLRKKKPELFEE